MWTEYKPSIRKKDTYFPAIFFVLADGNVSIGACTAYTNLDVVLITRTVIIQIMMSPQILKDINSSVDQSTVNTLISELGKEGL